MADDLAATLAGWDRRIKRYESLCLHEDAHEIALEAPRLVAALRAALERHQPVKYGLGVVCGKCRASWPCREVAAITAALAGKEAGDAQR